MGRPTHQGARASRPHKAWHSRGYLPHLDQPGIIQFITFRLSDSVPAKVIAAFPGSAGASPAVKLRKRTDGYMVQGHGECWLGDDRIAELVENALLYFDGVRYRLLAWVIMPNHVHALIEAFDGFPLDGVIHSWKSFTSKQANKILGRSGQFRMQDYFDRYIRDDNHLAAVTDYIERNPVKAGLAPSADAWRWGSAFRKSKGSLRDAAGETPALPQSPAT